MADKLASLANRSPTFTTSEALKVGVAPRDLYASRDAGELIELSRGVFRVADAPPTAHTSILAVSRRIPRGIICLTSALVYWELTDEPPADVHIAVPRGVRPPVVRAPLTTVHSFAPDTFELGLVQAEVSDVESVPMYSAARTVVDMVRMRNRLGRDLAYDSLRQYLSSKEGNPRRLMQLARSLRIGTAMRDALELLLR